MNYFFFQQYLSDLLEEGLLTARNGQGGQYYEINDKGLRVLEMFESILPAGLKTRLEESIPSIRRNVRMETFITADYVPEDENSYSVVCKIRENDFSLIEIKLAAGSREEARNICRNWTNSPQLIYSEILGTLMKERGNNTGKG
jgi:hypothetical protein